ncbi:flagellar basal body P-ring formation protein FlgA [Pseudohoeflea sp. DP4N28-3]|uniref:Flagella basal body P-ring formation protein FlgA n=2 Tax=Pseudohoeflea coraliihabitans TaxID=2860393 RepID=A0ABS6WNN8_9HYPH|nr:flagellar basal body P-ring formation protein FlgA [Pseudohoeflea sp. DP4N28-3]
MFGRTIKIFPACTAPLLALTLAVLLAAAGPAAAAPKIALVPERVIYPGEELTGQMVRPVEVLNPNLAAGYASQLDEIQGMVATRTLLPGRTIPVATLRQAWAVERGAPVVLIFADSGLFITAPGTPLENGAVGDLVRVRNTDSGVIVSGTIMNDGTIKVVRK